MTSGIRAEVKVDDPTVCPVARCSGATETSSLSISRSVDPTAPETVTEEFMLDSAADLEAVDVDVELSELFSYGEKTVYRFQRQLDDGCPCECIESFDCPVIDVRTRSGALYLTFHAPDMASLQEIIGTLNERYPTLDVQRLLQSEQKHTESSLVFVDRSTLTDRQREVLETAHRMGYFDHPKGANAGEVADELEITTSTFSEHLAAAQTKLLGAILDSER